MAEIVARSFGEGTTTYNDLAISPLIVPRNVQIDNEYTVRTSLG
jgi:hypothetical protein